MKQKTIFLFTAIWIFLCLGTLSFSDTITLGKEDDWNNIVKKERIRFDANGKQGFKDIKLTEAEYEVTVNTDFLLHFNMEKFNDVTGNYLLTKNNVEVLMEKHINVSNQYYKENFFLGNQPLFGEGCGVCRKSQSLIQFEAKNKAFFYPGKQWRDFSIEFWLKPVTINENDTIFYWSGNRLYNKRLIPQEVSCYFSNRRLVWNFKNFFVPFNKEPFELSVKGSELLIPGTWHHHCLRFDSNTGMVEYLVDGVSEDITYANFEGREVEEVFFPKTGSASKQQISVVPTYSGFIDEFQILRSFQNDPQITTYSSKKGEFVTDFIDLGHENSIIEGINIDYETPGNSDAFFAYRVITKDPIKIEDKDGWIFFKPSDEIDKSKRGRYIQLKVELYPNGTKDRSPRVSFIEIQYTPDLPPSSPAEVTAFPGSEQVSLYWSEVPEPDIKGYKIYYGKNPGYYFGTEASEGVSPIDVGNRMSFSITGLENGELYFFSIVAYDQAGIDHTSAFSEEVSARPSRLYQ